MPNYRYNSSDYMRRNGCARQTMPTQTSCPQSERSSCSQPERPACHDHSCEHDMLSEMPLAMAYVPWQKWRRLYEAEKGFQQGTIFEELDKPFRGMGGCGR